MLNQKNDIKFGDMAVNLGLLKQKDFKDCLNLQKQWFFQGEVFSLEQCLLRFQYLTPQQIAIVHQQLQKKDQSPTSSFKTFGRYQIIIEIGRGSMGVVYKAYDPELKRIIAIKILENKGHDDIERFLREAKATAKLKHPNIVEVYDIGCVETQYFYAMDYIEGITLDELAKKRKLTIKQCVSIMVKISHGIAYAHQEGVIHRDLKPANIMIDKDGNPKVMDFGLAKILDEHDELSKSGMIIGTLQYMSPEQAEGNIHLIGKHSDVYSLGAIFYELLTGRATFIGNSFAQVIDQILYKAPTPPTSIKKIIPHELECICLKALEKKIENRYSDAEAFAYDLCNFIEGKSIAARKVPIGVRRTFLQARFYKKNILITLIVAVVILTVSIYIAFGESRSIQSTIKYVEKKLTTLKPHTHFLSENESVPYIALHKQNKELEDNIHQYIELNYLLQKNLVLYKKNNKATDVLLAINREIILCAMLANDRLTSTIYLKTSEVICSEERFKEFRSEIVTEQQKVKEYFANRIDFIMNDIMTKSPDYITFYSNEIQKMPHEYILPQLFLYINSKDITKKFLSIHALSKINNNSFKFNNKDRIDYLLEELQSIDIKRDIAESIKIIQALFFCLPDLRVVTSLKNTLAQIEYQTILWYEIIHKYQDFLQQNLQITEEELIGNLKEKAYVFIQKQQGIFSCKITNDIVVEKISQPLKKIDVVYKTEKENKVSDPKCRTFLFDHVFSELTILSMSKEHAFLYYAENKDTIARDKALDKAIMEFYNTQKQQDKILYIEQSHTLPIKDIYKTYASYEYKDNNNNIIKENRWFFLESVAGYYYILGSQSE